MLILKGRFCEDTICVFSYLQASFFQIYFRKSITRSSNLYTIRGLRLLIRTSIATGSRLKTFFSHKTILNYSSKHSKTYIGRLLTSQSRYWTCKYNFEIYFKTKTIEHIRFGIFVYDVYSRNIHWTLFTGKKRIEIVLIK